MSRSFAILLRETREQTPDPQKPGKTLSQPRMAEIIGVSLGAYRLYEYDQRTPHPVIRREIFRLFPSIMSAE